MKKKVLVVEDDKDFLEIVLLTLGRAGYDVRPCMVGSDVLNAVADFDPDLVVLDVMLPGVDGYTLRHRLGEQPTTKDLPVVILTALEPSRALFRDKNTTFLTKPVRIEHLLEAVSKALDSKHG